MGDVAAQQKVGGASAADQAYGNQQAPSTVGKGTQVDAAGGAAPATAPGVRPPTPPEFANMDPALVDKLWQSRAEIAIDRPAFKVTDDKFWDAMKTIGAADLHTLNVVKSGAVGVGVWSYVDTICGWYTYGSSYGIKFHGNPMGIVTNGQWGKDFPQQAVRNEHENTAHDWYRNNSGAGNPGMHLGINAGAGYTNIHWDPTNPMDHVGDNSIHLVTVPGEGIPVPIFEPKGIAVYSPQELIKHAAEIGKFGGTVQNALKKPNTPNEKFLKFTAALDYVEQARHFADYEEAAPDKGNAASSAAIVAEMRRTFALIAPLHEEAKPLAQLPDDQAQGGLDALMTRLDAATEAMYAACAALVVFLKSETNTVGDKPYDTAAKWAPPAQAYLAGDDIVAMQKLRSARKKKPKPEEDDGGEH